MLAILAILTILPMKKKKAELLAIRFANPENAKKFKAQVSKIKLNIKLACIDQCFVMSVSADMIRDDWRTVVVVELYWMISYPLLSNTLMSYPKIRYSMCTTYIL